MSPYAYKVKINYGREKIRQDHQHELDTQCLSIALLAPIVGDADFSVVESEWNSCTIYWSTARDETDEERRDRIAKAEAYNAEVERRQQYRRPPTTPQPMKEDPKNGN